VRCAGLGALVRMGRATPQDAALIIEDVDPHARRYACEMGSKLPGANFATLLTDDDMVVEAACFALGELRDLNAVPALVRIASEHANPLCRESAVAALGAIGDQRGLPAILSALGTTPQIRRRAVIALAAFETDECEAALRRCLKDRDWQVRQAAQDVLGLTTPDR